MCSYRDGLAGHYAKWNKSDKDKKLYVTTFMWNLRTETNKMNVTNRNRLTDVENKLVVTSGEKEGVGARQKQGIKRYKWPYKMNKLQGYIVKPWECSQYFIIILKRV